MLLAPVASADVRAPLRTVAGKGFCDPIEPAIATLDDGGMVVVWTDAEPDANGVWARLYDASGSPRGPAFPVHVGTAHPRVGPGVAAVPGGGFLVTWLDRVSSSWRFRGFAPDGTTLGPEHDLPGAATPVAAGEGTFLAAARDGDTITVSRFDISGSVLGSFELVVEPVEGTAAPVVGQPVLAALPGGEIVVAWGAIQDILMVRERHTVELRRFAADGSPLGPRRVLDQTELVTLGEPRLAMLADGSVIVGWPRLLDDGRYGLMAQGFTPDGQSASPAHRIDGGTGSLVLPELDLAPIGPESTAAVWTERETPDAPGLRLRSRRLAGRTADPVGPVDSLDAADSGTERAPAVAGLPGGRHAVGWWKQTDLFFLTPPPQCAVSDGVFLQLVPAPCEDRPGAACLQGERFAVEVEWEAPRQGTRGEGHPVPVTSDTGAFWFFDPDNLELMVKVLDGRAVNNHLWVFYGALSNVAYTITVTDLATERVRTFTNPAGTLASFGDPRAFPEEALEAGMLSPLRSTPTPQPGRASEDGAGPCAPRTQLPQVRRPGLCLAGGRFEVEVEWEDSRSATSGTGRDRPLTDDTGAFWFFDPDNLELMVKVLDGRAVNGHFWVFYGGLSDVAYTITVRDTVRGTERIFESPPGEFGSGADVRAFPGSLP